MQRWEHSYLDSAKMTKVYATTSTHALIAKFKYKLPGKNSNPNVNV